MIKFEKNKIERKNVLIFLTFTFVLSWLAMGYVIYLGGLHKSGRFIFLVMWTPGLVALAYRFFAKIGFGDIGVRLGKVKY